MKTLIVGLGNIAKIHGWAFAEAGIDVTHVVRDGSKGKHSGEIKLDVLDLREGHPETQQASYTPKIVEAGELEPADGYELVMFPTKQYQLADGVKQYKDHVSPDAILLMFAANWEGPEAVDALVPRERYLWGYAAVNGGVLDGVLVANVRGDYRIGMMDGCSRDKLDRVVDLFAKAGFKPDMQDNIMDWLWQHHAVNAGIVGMALYAGGIGELMSDGVLSLFMLYAVRDALKVLEARGVDPRKLEDSKPYLEPSAGEFMKGYADSVVSTPYGQRVIKAGHFRGNPEEMKRFYLDVVATGEKLGVEMPHLEAMKSRIKAL